MLKNTITNAKNSFTAGQKFQHYNGYIWTITQVSGNSISMESKNQTDGQTVKGSMTVKDLQEIIKAGYYTPLK